MTPSRSLRALLIGGLASANLLVIALAAHSLHASHQQYEQQARTQTQNVASALDQSVSGSIQKIDLALRSVVDELEHQLAGKGIDEARMTDFLGRFEERLPEIEAIRVADAQGTVVLGKGLDKSKRPSWADREYFIFLREHPQGGLQISKPRMGRVAKQYIMGFARRYNYPDGSFAGVVSAPIAIEHFTTLLGQFSIGKSGTLILRDADLGLITRLPPIPDQPTGQIGNAGVSKELRKLAESGQRSATYYLSNSPDGFERILTFHRVTQAPIFAIVGMASTDYLADWYGDVLRTLGLTAGFILLSVLMGALQLRLLAQAEQREHAAEAANLAKSQFLATMSHEIRTPMNGVLGMAQLLMQDRVSDDERLDYARTIYKSGHTLLTILNDILDLSKVEAGKLQLDSAAFSPADLLHDTAALFAEFAHDKGVSLEASWEGDSDRRFVSDPVRLRQVLSNLVGNAIKFTPEGGRVRLRAEVAGRADDDFLLCFYVEDTGIGISPEVQHLLFKPFSQVDASITRHFGGTGLGLAIVQGLVHLMGGEIGVESAEGTGSTFWFSVRAKATDGDTRSETRTPELPVAVTGDAPRRRVLVVEDMAVNRIVAEAMLVKLGCDTAHADDGRAAVEMITSAAEPFDLVLMDCQMPEMDGFEATRRIRAWEHETGRKPLRIVALTAAAFPEDQEACRAAGMDGFVAKPINLHDLADVVARWCPAAGRDAAN